MKVLIVDDEQLARELLANYCNKVPNLEVIAQCKNPLGALDVLQKESIDLILLDIQMPDLTGIEFLKTLEQKPMVIFTTAYPEYALQGYELDVIDYLLKPSPFERFVQAINKASKQNSNGASSPTIDKKADFLILKADHKIYRLKYSDILYIEGLKEYVSYYTADQRIIVLQSLKGLEESLPRDRFMRIHKSYIINREHVKAIDGNQVEILDRKIPIGKSYKDTVKTNIFS